MATNKLICEECDWRGTVDSALHAQNPFSADEEIHGCPSCFTPCHLVFACEHDGCWLEVSCGTPTHDGEYAQTCGKHRPVSGSLPLASRACVDDEMTEPDPLKLELWLERDYIAKRGHNSLSITVDAVEFSAEMNAYVASQSRAWAKKKVSSAWLKLI